jgi:pullulanase
MRRFFSTLAKAVFLAALLGCERTEKQFPAVVPGLPPPKAEGVEIATVQIKPPPGNAGHRLFAGLKRDGHIVARGDGTVGTNSLTEIVLRTLDKSTAMPNGAYDLWLVIDRDGWQACHPSFGDLYLRDTWQWPKASHVIRCDNPTAWKARGFSHPESVVTIHYHRYDEDYDDVGIWSWDANYKKSPEQNELLEVGRDDYGLVFQLDRADYGSDKIGLVPRLHADWNYKDGDDKFWTPDLGQEVYLVGTKNRVWSIKPETGPQVVAAYLDTRSQLEVELSRRINTVPAVTVKDRDGQAFAATASLKQRNTLAVSLTQPLDVAANHYAIAVEGFAGSVPLTPRGILDDASLFCDADAVLGASYAREATSFRVFAPKAPAVKVVLYDQATGNAGRREVPMAPASKGIWETRVAGDLTGKFYVYGLNDREVLDIYAVNAVDRSRRARITDLAGTGRVPAGPRVESPVDMVVYEIHVRDFTIATNSPAKPEDRGKYLGFIEAADHLKELGVTHVQLLPLQDFENDETSTNYNWGYVTVDYASPDGWFASSPTDDSRIREFKQLVAALHERGIGVIMDVVYNHTANNAPFNALVPRYYYRLDEKGGLSNGSGCGNEFRTESPMGRKYILDTLKFWVKEYGVDGFRFDLMALIDLDTMKQIERELPGIVLYGEPWASGKTPLKRQTNKQTITGTRLGAFNDNFRNALIGSPFDKTHGGFIQEGKDSGAVKRSLQGQWRDWGDGPPQVINYLSCHDNYVMYDKLKASKPGASHQEIIEMMKLGYLILFTAQGVPFIHGGEEFARTKQGHENSYNAPDEINQVDWSLKTQNADLFRYVRDLIALRKAHPVFRLRAKEQIAAWLSFPETGAPNVLMAVYDAGNVKGEPWKKVCVIANAADSNSTDVKLPDGLWHIAFVKDGVVNGNQTAESSVRVRYKSGLILFQP